MKKILIAVLTILVLAVCACSGVTETGNPSTTPTPPQNTGGGGGGGGDAEGGDNGSAPASPASAGGTYNNYEYGVTVKYPEGWYDVTSANDVSAVTFIQNATPATKAKVSFNILETKPASLSAYLAETYPGYPFSSYSNGTISGLMYDDPSTGDGGSDKKVYFFLGGSVLVKVDAEVFTDGNTSFEVLLAGISFVGQE